MSDKSAENLRRLRAWDAEWDESKHSRADNGQFTSGGGGGGAKKAPEYGGYTPYKFHGTKEQIFKQATAQSKKNAAMAAVLANATPVKAKFSKKEQDVLKGTDASEKDIQKLIGQIPHMSDPEAWSRVHDFCFSDEQADQVFKILKSKAAKAAKPAKAAGSGDVFKKHGISSKDVAEMKSAMGNPFTRQAVWSDLKTRFRLSDDQADAVFNALKTGR